MKIKTQSLTLLQLDYAVAKANGDESRLLFEGDSDQGITGMRFDLHYGKWSPSTQWDQAGPIIDRERIDVFSTSNGNGWFAQTNIRVYNAYGHTFLEAAMRCYVVSILGDEVEIPGELCK